MENKNFDTGRICPICNDKVMCRYKDSITTKKTRIFCSTLCSNESQRKPKRPLEVRFWEKVKVIKCSKETDGQRDCWEWTGSVDGGGYGTLSSSKEIKSPYKAHRISWEIKYGKIPETLSVLHACDNPKCVNPEHLMLGSSKANMIDMARKNRVNEISKKNLRSSGRSNNGKLK